MKQTLTSNTRARVTVTLEFTVPDNWGETCPMGQVHRQAIQSALERFQAEITAGRVKVIGEPLVTVILIDAQ